MTCFSAQVISCCEGKNGYEIELDRTAFYPEGGGQPADTGVLRPAGKEGARAGSGSSDAKARACGEKVTAEERIGRGSIAVMDVQLREGRILHFCSGPLAPGTAVEGELDWERRFLHSQQHSGEHIFSGIVHKLYGYDNVGFHMGREAVTVDFNGMLSEEEIEKAEQMANEAVYADETIRSWYPPLEELHRLSYRSKKELEGPVRIVEVPKADICACCGTHVKRTGEIGMIKAVESMKYKSGVRITLQIGKKALEDYGGKNRCVRELCRLFSAKPEGLAEAAAAQQDAMISLKYRMTALKLRLFEGLVKELEGKETACLFEEDLTAAEVRQLCDRCIRSVKLAAVFSGNDEEGYKYVLGIAPEAAGPEEAHEKGYDVAALGKRLNAALSGRGGGRGNMVQGSVTASREAVEAFLLAEGILVP